MPRARGAKKGNGLYVHNVKVPGNFVDSNHLNLCLVQTPPPKRERLYDDSRPEYVSLVKEFLEKEKVKHFPGDRPIIIIFPELTFGVEDWYKINDLINKYKGKIVLIAGFGFTHGNKLNEIFTDRTRHHGTEIIKSWREGESGFPGDDRRYNYGWCWLRYPADGTEKLTTKSVIYVKHFPEQCAELGQIDYLDGGVSQVCIQTNGLDIWPIICSDFIYNGDGKTPTSEMVTVCNKTNLLPEATRKYMLVAGQLYQKDPHASAWQDALNRIFTNLDITAHNHFAIALANHAMGKHDKDESNDKLRNLSGIYIHADAAHIVKHEIKKGTRLHKNGNFVARLVRSTEPLLISGKLKFKTVPDAERHNWPATLHNQITTNHDHGLSYQLREYSEFEHQPYELARFICRNCSCGYGHHATKEIFSALCWLKLQIKTTIKGVQADNLIALIKSGMAPGSYSTSLCDKLHEHRDDLIKALRCISVLMYCNIAHLVAEETAQLRTNIGNIDINIWSDKSKHAYDMKNAMENSLTQYKKPLIMCIAPGMGHIDEDQITPGASSITHAPSESIGSPPRPFSIYLLPLTTIENCYQDATTSKINCMRLSGIIGMLSSGSVSYA